MKQLIRSLILRVVTGATASKPAKRLYWPGSYTWHLMNGCGPIEAAKKYYKYRSRSK